MVQAIEYLASLGHRNIAFLGGEAGITITESQLKVYKDTLSRLGLHFRDQKKGNRHASKVILPAS